MSNMATLPWAFALAAAGVVRALPPLEDAIREAVTPLLQNQSTSYNDSAWGFSYVDATTRISLCVGYSDLETKTPCSATDKHAYGSTTKVFTSVMILKLAEQGKLHLNDSVVAHADDYVRHLSQGATSLVSLFGPQIHNVTIRHLLQMTSGIDEYDNKILRRYQNTNRTGDLDPLWILNFTNRTFLCAPGTCSAYSSTNYVILGLVLANHAGANRWEDFDQRSWMPEFLMTSTSSSFQDMYYPIHGPCSNFTSADQNRRSSSMHGYQQAKFLSGKHPAIMSKKDLDVYDMSCLQGWTCGNLISPTVSVAEFFWMLLGPPSNDPSTALLRPESVQEMLSFRLGTYLGRASEFGYGLGLMNFTSMDWGFQFEGQFYGHNGLTYGFGSQSGYHLDLEFAVSWNNNVEHWIGPDDKTSTTEANPVYKAVAAVVKQYRAVGVKEAFVLV